MNRFAITALVALAAGNLLLPAMEAQLPGTSRTDLQRYDLSVAGREVVQVRVDFEPGFVAAKHRHPGEEVVYVIEGTLVYYVEGRQPKTYRAGDVLVIPSGAVHWVENIGKDKGAELATYIVEKGKALIELAE